MENLIWIQGLAQGKQAYESKNPRFKEEFDDTAANANWFNLDSRIVLVAEDDTHVDNGENDQEEGEETTEWQYAIYWLLDQVVHTKRRGDQAWRERFER